MDYISGKMVALSILALPFLLTVTIREALRGYVAHRLGDNTPAYNGRLTANPLAHADPIWTGVVPVVAFVVLNFPILLGQAKPMPVDPRNFSDPKGDMLKFTLAAPISGFLVAFLFAIVFHAAFALGFTGQDWITNTAYYGVYLAMIFTVIGLLPIPPLDGGKILVLLLPYETGRSLQAVEPYSFFIVIGIFIFAPAIFQGPADLLTQTILGVVGIFF
ncbi:MAG: site-2 protease family protein [Alphaproteobacteria bacterium]|nr:site-2 protease family protein [Alphaproteobacteria bacterium]